MSRSSEVPESFIEQVKEALEKLYDFPALQENQLAQQLYPQKPDLHTPVAHLLRSHLFDAIESLNPGQNVAAHSGTVRVYNLIYMHYVGRLTIQQAAWEVGVSLRQAYRDLRRGQELVSAVLWHKLQVEPPVTRQLTSVNAELVRIEDHVTVTKMHELLESAIRPVQILAHKYDIPIHVDAPSDPVMMTTNPMMARQVLTHILSQIIQQIRPSRMDIKLLDDPQFMRVHYAGKSRLHVKPVIRQMMEQIQWEVQFNEDETLQELCLISYRLHSLVLLMDDNEGLVHLLQRYLTNDAYTVLSTSNNEEGLQLISQLQPDVIILDVMMPGIDGWEVLQRLRTRNETQHIPVIICSVINDPELAFALGASQYVSKPVTREALLDALQALHL